MRLTGGSLRAPAVLVTLRLVVRCVRATRVTRCIIKTGLLTLTMVLAVRTLRKWRSSISGLASSRASSQAVGRFGERHGTTTIFILILVMVPTFVQRLKQPVAVVELVASRC